MASKYINYRASKVIEVEDAVPIQINDTIYNLIAIVSPEPSPKSRAYKQRESLSPFIASRTSFVYTQRGFYLLRAVLPIGTFLKCTVDVRFAECTSATPIPPCVHARLLPRLEKEDNTLYYALVLYGLVNRATDYKCKTYGVAKYFGTMKHDQYALEYADLKFMAEYQVTNVGLRLLKIHPNNKENENILPVHYSFYSDVDRTLNSSRFAEDAVATLRESFIPSLLDFGHHFN